jgi:hypothetical protein
MIKPLTLERTISLELVTTIRRTSTSKASIKEAQNTKQLGRRLARGWHHIPPGHAGIADGQAFQQAREPAGASSHARAFPQEVHHGSGTARQEYEQKDQLVRPLAS